MDIYMYASCHGVSHWCAARARPSLREMEWNGFVASRAFPKPFPEEEPAVRPTGPLGGAGLANLSQLCRLAHANPGRFIIHNKNSNMNINKNTPSQSFKLAHANPRRFINVISTSYMIDCRCGRGRYPVEGEMALGVRPGTAWHWAVRSGTAWHWAVR